jgi:hypothetical protein
MQTERNSSTIMMNNYSTPNLQKIANSNIWSSNKSLEL